MFWWSLFGTGAAFSIGLIATVGAGLAEVDWFAYLALAAWAIPVLLGMTAALVAVARALPFGRLRRRALQWMLCAAAVIPTTPWIGATYATLTDPTAPWTEQLVVALLCVLLAAMPAVCFLVPMPRIQRDGYPRLIARHPVASESLPTPAVGLIAASTQPAGLDHGAPAQAATHVGSLGPAQDVLHMTAFVGSSVWQALVRATKEEPPAESVARGVASLLGQPSAPDMSTGVDVVISDAGLVVSRSASQFHRMLFGNLPFPEIQLKWEDISSVEKVKWGNRLRFTVSAPPLPVFNLSTLSKRTLRRLTGALEVHGVTITGQRRFNAPVSGPMAS